MILNSRLISPKIPIGKVKDRINQLFSGGYFNGYDIRLKIFDKDGVGTGKIAGLEYYYDLKNRFDQPDFQTDYDDLFIDSNFLSTGRKRYLSFVELERYGNRTGYLILELVQKKQVSRSVYPELLIDNPARSFNNFDYAVFDKNRLSHSVGGFNYKANFSPSWLKRTSIFGAGIEQSGHHHWATNSQDRTIVITSDKYSIWRIFSNFSFLFLLFLFVVVIITLANTAANYHHVKSFNFSTKILIYLGCAFAIPLLLVGAAILNTINISYKDEIDKSYQKQTVAMGENFVDLLTGFYNSDINRDELTNELLLISKSSRADVNLFNASGELISTSQPKVFENGLSHPLINPEALQQIRFDKKDKLILGESIGQLTYKTSFVAIRSYDDDKLLGIMSSPFFSSKNHLRRQQNEVFNNIVNISILIFIFSIGFSYLAVRRLTNPIILIATKLKSTELSEENPPLEWNNDDEIGVLVREYNQMLEKLEFSKQELARTEKEAAWREMAKQVAHEIKNPLTPMKLTLQHLDRTIDKDDKRRNALSTLLSQVDTLDQIVTSFSHFARMPDPQNEEFNLIDELKKSIDLHSDKKIDLHFDDGIIPVHADKKLFGRIFNNIILNAFQAMHEVSNPHLIVECKREKEKALISFADVGTGISDDIKDKVFIPNFSTKNTGSGIGLAVAKRGIENAGGYIWFENNSDDGVIFYIELPIFHKN